MRPSPLQRTVTGILGLWLIATVSGVALQACPEHGGGWLGMSAAMMAELPANAPGVVPGRDQAADGPGMPGMPADMQRAHDGAPAGGTDPSPDPHHGPGHHGHQCTCPGVCCAIGAITAPVGRLVAIPVVPVALAAAAPRAERDAPIRAAPDVVLPLPLGPPTLRA